MAVITPGESKKQTSAQKPAQATVQQATQIPTQEAVIMNQKVTRPTGPLALATFHNRPVSRTGTGEVVAKYVKALKEKVEALGMSQDEWDVVAFDSQQQLTSYASVIYALRKVIAGELYVSTHILLLEASGARPQPRIINLNGGYGGQQVEVQMTAGDAVNGKYWEKVSAFLTQTYGGRVKVINAGHSVIHDEVTPENEALIQSIVYNASNAVIGSLNDIAKIDEVFTTDFMKASGATFEVRADFSPAQKATMDGMPVRSDLDIVLRGLAGNAQEDSEQVVEVTSLSSYVDLQYVGAPMQQQPQWGMQQQPQIQTQQYKPRLVITGMQSQLSGITPELQLTALSTAILANENYLWTGVYDDRYLGNVKKPTNDLRDIGAVGWEVSFQPGQPAQAIDTKANSFDANQRYQFLSSIFQPGLIYSMLVPEADEMSWVNSAFSAAACGVLSAKQSIFAAADRLTGGLFSQMFDAAQPIAISNGRVHTGYYIDENGNKRDIRDIDYLAILNLLGAKNPEAVVDWSQTFDNTDIPEPIRLEKRFKMLRLVLGDSLRLTGYATLITFNPAFLECLAAAIAQKVTFQKGSLIRGFTTFQRGNNAVAQFAMTSVNNGLFTYNNPTMGQVGQPMYHGTRWV